MLARIRSLLRVKRLYDLLERRNERLRDVLSHYLDSHTVNQILANLED